ncbi:LYRM2 protein, partial [Polypterus senegalus]|nr:LYR motif-containing protein 2 [Polypterus senegalus]XP_039603924.1 LYR motif-containing protein 2 [Polypterus senegalus]XP_039603925.1 LYR motif-containing protein 2 [Polypterus senegalus]MBN3291670.1 LYRM2 protein [Polypterus senegalus]
MAASMIPPAALNLKQFLQRQKVLSLYRSILRTIRKVPDKEDQQYLKNWAREEFKRNKNVKEEDVIRMMLTQGRRQLEDLTRTLQLAQSS